ncbi:MAG: response regulator transcription factor [Acidobacteria bacterium]|nr:response regulator transcription factor [Acidobacteriota bacterium]
MSRILVVDDEQHIADGLRFNLEAEGHEVLIATRAAEAIALLIDTGEAVDLVVLDVMLPDGDGFTVATTLRASGVFVPVLMLTARGRPEDVLKGFEAGADDYLSKPFELSILLARIHGLLRRRQWNEAGAPDSGGVGATPGSGDPVPDVYTFSGRTLDFGAMELHARGRSFRLTLMECGLLRHLVRNAGRAVSRRTLLEEVWGLHEETDTRAIDNFIVRLRRYMEESPSSPEFLLTVRGVGYKFVPEGGKQAV